MKPTAWALVIVLLAGCASRPADEQEPSVAEATREAIQDILTTPLDADEYAETVRCLSTHAYRSVEVLDNQNVLFKGPGDRAWLNQLRHPCVGLRPRDTLQFRLRDNRVCDMDTFEAVDTFLRVWSRTSAMCSLGQFQPVTPEQVEAIRAAVKEARESR
jgi:hypothetical protein